MNKKQFPQTIWQSIIVVLLLFFYTFPLVFLEKKIFGNNPDTFRITIIFFIASVFTILTVHFINIKRSLEVSKIKITKDKSFLILIFILILFQIFFNKPFNNYINALLNQHFVIENPFQIKNIGLTLGALLVAPLIEETIFRKIILGGLLNKYSIKKSVLISSLLFGIMHPHPSQFFGALIIGLYFGWIYSLTKNIGNVILLHFIANLTTVCLGFINYKFGENNLIKIYGNYSIFILILSFLLLGYAVYYIIKNKEQIINKLKQLDAPQRLPI